MICIIYYITICHITTFAFKCGTFEVEERLKCSLHQRQWFEWMEQNGTVADYETYLMLMRSA